MPIFEGSAWVYKKGSLPSSPARWPLSSFFFPFRLPIVQYPNIAAGVIPKVAQSKRAIFRVGSALPET